MNKPLQDKVAVISGASHGLGQATAEHLAALGAHVCLIARRMGPLQEVADAIKNAGGAASAFPCDVSAPAQVQATADVIGQALGQVHILVNNAGIPAPRSFRGNEF